MKNENFSRYLESVRSGESTSEGWAEFLRCTHNKFPASTSKFYSNAYDSNRKNSYDICATHLQKIRPNPKSILDLACGDGALLESLSIFKSDTKLVGLDLSKEELKRASERLSNKITLVEANILEKKFPANSFDAVTCHMAFMLLTPMDEVANEIKRIISSNSVLQIAIRDVSNPTSIDREVGEYIGSFVSNLYPMFASNILDRRGSTSNGISEILNSNGVEVKDIDSINYTVDMKTSPKGLWDIVGGTYRAQFLSEAEFRQLERGFIDHFTDKYGLSINYGVAMQSLIFSIEKKSESNFSRKNRCDDDS